MRSQATLTVLPVERPLVGRVSPPGSKSITNRALLLAGLAKGTSRLTGALKSDDTRVMSEALRLMGVRVDEPDDSTFVVTSSGHWQAPQQALFLGNAGTATRFLTAALANFEGDFVVDGDEYMRKRPIGPLVDALQRMGVEVSAPTGCPPVAIKGKGGLAAGRIEIDGNLSSQYVSALLMAGACGKGPLEVALTGSEIGARGYVDLTLAAMQAFGAEVQAIGDAAWKVSATGYRATDFHIEPDASAATYLWAAQALTQGDIDLGVATDAFTQPDALASHIIAGFPNMPAVIDGSQMQDAIPTLAVLAAFNNQPVRFVGIANLRVKECDRISALSHGLCAIAPGLAVEEGDDLVVNAKPALAGTTVDALIDTHADHRIAMCFALAGLKIAGIRILDPDCVGKTYPGYWDALASLGVGIQR
ncbi:3-phosphoshikimate 1-carboxyvinyltransferase [Pseudomonas alliivorans]|nr:3-phosphoshikimate 1-carboxyvinyltransferase [Pseudomonas alliivorans]MEE4700866.1 3-phosphoshikimate 1-carboxyvinyltransferase [Pseudomonas alliivorans]MEE4736845.1 3-phosphoshikimate 1-carboxyvinyltransferase [Pseudomonas alliivorans]